MSRVDINVQVYFYFDRLTKYTSTSKEFQNKTTGFPNISLGKTQTLNGSSNIYISLILSLLYTCRCHKFVLAATREFWCFQLVVLLIGKVCLEWSQLRESFSLYSPDILPLPPRFYSMKYPGDFSGAHTACARKNVREWDSEGDVRAVD